MKFNTKTIHGGQKNVDPAYNAVMPPIYQTSTYAQSTPGGHKGFEYSRSGNPTRAALERSLASIENGDYGMAFGSGLAAIDAVIKLFKPGDEIVSTNDLYGGSYRLFTSIFENLGIKFHFIGMQEAENIESYINENTKLIWVETPTNPMMNIIDIEATAKIAKKHHILLAVDNTFATPYLQQPLDLGADIVMHSATKYLGGHSDVVMGGLVVKDKALADKLYFIQNASGGVCGPQDSFLVLRGIKTLHLRMQRHCENGEKIARFLKEHPGVAQVNWPGFEDHPNHEIAKKQMKGFGGMISFSTTQGTAESAVKILENLKVFTLAESLGGVESLAGHPASMTHASIPKEEREKTGVVDSLIRLSVGIEDGDDLVEDLKQALG
ncbi:cystathionine gamma-synthase [Zunongwangia profunda]|uniref:Cys/Met metabolism pyridoxal-phosphate-dependent enzyme n=2 Tax=Zunongwangia profunda TaxID=398743 RepID=D5BDW0_ZUNPS|nr:cystathionine gamma-synthase [Zunongwangia profunda]ADF50701.1 Cys/Met metabolism pyridoxal-phosphate-dependent enzyme [Zunongwangia profunda SM-A87]MAS71519.1 cystathionine gamma-synthase [Zunongwangia sp.]HAJ82555.1 cystathionine gamma-synthase [Zunongwangia profunda]HCV81641.1 cystathionine gamma-synthase [Zunongwangia profunda]|tara:strand:- start:734 stop:1876 length:1143 start_codon:yes stop_codon:yes gene_type:complete